MLLLFLSLVLPLLSIHTHTRNATITEEAHRSRSRSPSACSRRCNAGRCECWTLPRSARHHRSPARSGRTPLAGCRRCPSARGRCWKGTAHRRVVALRPWLDSCCRQVKRVMDSRANSRANVMTVCHPSVRMRSSKTWSSSKFGAVAARMSARMSSWKEGACQARCSRFNAHGSTYWS